MPSTATAVEPLSRNIIRVKQAGLGQPHVVFMSAADCVFNGLGGRQLTTDAVYFSVESCPRAVGEEGRWACDDGVLPT